MSHAGRRQGMMPELAQRQNALTAEDLANAKQREILLSS
jgi:hypothetical protein